MPEKDMQNILAQEDHKQGTLSKDRQAGHNHSYGCNNAKRGRDDLELFSGNAGIASQKLHCGGHCIVEEGSEASHEKRGRERLR